MGKKKRRIRLSVRAVVVTRFGGSYPLNNAYIRLYKLIWFSFKRVGEGRTDDAGRVRFEVGTGLYKVRGEAIAWESSYGDKIVRQTTKVEGIVPIIGSSSVLLRFSEEAVSFAPPIPAPAPTPAPSPIPTSKYIANRNTKEVHLAKCVWVTKMLARNKVPYDDLEKAHADGYDNCFYCIGDSKR